MIALEIETSRLSLRPLLASDARVITELVQDPQIYRTVARIAPGQSIDTTRAFLKATEEGHYADTDHVCAIEQGGALIGCVGVHRRTRQDLFELGYWLAPEAWGKGYATEAADALLSRLTRRAGERAFVSGYFTDNPASGQVLRKLGFLPCGLRPVYCLGRDTNLPHRDMVWVAG